MKPDKSQVRTPPLSAARVALILMLWIPIEPLLAQDLGSLKPFTSEASLSKYLEQFKTSRPGGAGGVGDAVSLESVVVTGSLVTSITNTQTDGVDEGGIVKLHGDYLVILRRGRLFTVSIRGRDLRPVSWIDAFGPGINPQSAWYDEMLIYQDRIIVIGYSYGQGGTDVGFFRIDARGRLSYEATYQLRSNDYYSSRNYASRLTDGKLVFYTPMWVTGSLDDLPAVRKWRDFVNPSTSDDDRDGQDDFERIAPIRHVYRPVKPLEDSDEPTLHTVTTCDLRSPDVKCEAVVVLGPSGRTFYVSKSAVYVWTGEEYRRGRDRSNQGVLYRMPLDGGNPTALQVAGMPIDQFSFMENDGFLNVLVQSEGGGDRMWRAEVAPGDVALFRARVDEFGDGTRGIRWRDYRPLIKPNDDCSFHNRFVGNSLLYGCGDSWGQPEGAASTLHVVSIQNDRATQLSLPHGVDRIEVMGTDGVVIGTDAKESLHFSGVSLESEPRIVQRHVIEKAAQGELRSHGFFYRTDEVDGGILGLPIRGAGAAGYKHLFEDSAAIVFLGNRSDTFRQLGQLAASASDDDSDDMDSCRASCVDWYGNARPIFIGDRIFALLGYELVEGVIRGKQLVERQRTVFAPLIVDD